MPFAIGIMIAAMLLWMSGARRRKASRRQTHHEVATTLQTGLPAPETALGQKARQVAEAQEAKLTAPPPVHGTARWGGVDDAVLLLEGIKLRTRQGTWGLHLGTLLTPDGTDTKLPLVATYPGHLLTVAGTGQGKSATQIVENLLTYQGSVVVIDPKGELYALTAAKRREMGRVVRLAPLAGRDEHTDRYNPLDELGDERELGRRSRHLAEMLIVRQGDKGAAEAAFFENEAINLLTALIMFVVDLTEDKSLRSARTLAEVRRLCSLPTLAGRAERDPKIREYLEDVFNCMMQSKHPYVRGQGARFISYEAKLIGSFLSELNSNMAFFDGHPGFAEVTSGSDFQFSELADTPTTVYLSIPLKDLPTSFRFLRMMVGMAFAALEERTDAELASILFILDEFPALRDMQFMREAVAQMRSSGAWFWFFVQDVAQLEGTYGRWANVFLSQTDHQIFFGAVNDRNTKTYVSSALGVGTYAYRDANVTWSQSVGINDSENHSPLQLGGIGSGRNVGQTINVSEPVMLAARPLLTPFEVGTYLSERLPGETHPTTTIIFSKQAGGYPLRARRRHWKTTVSPQAGAVIIMPRRKEAR
jgi:type IV secretion system protein VirD4